MISSLRFLFLFFLYFDHFAAFVKTAVGTDRVWKAHGTAIRAGGEVTWLQSIVRAAHIAAALRVFALWMWGHETFSFILHVIGADSRPPLHGLRMKRADYSGRIEERQV